MFSQITTPHVAERPPETYIESVSGGGRADPRVTSELRIPPMFSSKIQAERDITNIRLGAKSPLLFVGEATC